MSRRFRWTRPLPRGEATVTRVVGDHEDGDDPQRRYTLDGASDATVEPTEGVSVERDGGKQWLTVADGAGLAVVRVRVRGERTTLRVPGPTVDERVTETARGDENAARDLLAASEGAVALAVACGGFLAAEQFASLVATLARADDRASDALHAVRYDLLRISATTPAGPDIDSRERFEALASGLDDASEIGDVDAVDALAATVAVACDSPRECHDLLYRLGYDLGDVIERDDRFLAYYLAFVASTAGVGEANRRASRHPTELTYDEATDRAEGADYWERGEAWRAAVAPAARKSREAFAYVLANALYWTGEVSRRDSRAPELCFSGAVAAGREIGLDWVVGHARYERARAVGHRHRSKRNHAVAVAAFDDAREIAGEYAFLDPWEPTYTRAVVASNYHSTRGDHERAIDALDDGEAALAEQDVPAERREEMLAHLDAQRHERRAILADESGARLTHLEAARDGYEAIGFERSVERIEAKLGGGADSAGAESTESNEARVATPRRRLRGSRDRGPSLSDIPTLHDFLTEPDPDAVGSADPGVLPDEQGDDGLGGGEFGDDEFGSDPRY
ncbi:hypothetical protein [Halobacterium litoreum]|uniref:Tetratricopeptide repeat-containing protein n=1 Tax=Halobacterium litoreum TaxID=2039234 RepID=A0ABD5NBK4_9EURY|nr:hypothetical protein [Halobacterium litoreum]UHH14533.1 hypothetical protein LT972_05920 [Halobacterium litoreum]